MKLRCEVRKEGKGWMNRRRGKPSGDGAAGRERAIWRGSSRLCSSQVCKRRASVPYCGGEKKREREGKMARIHGYVHG